MLLYIWQFSTMTDTSFPTFIQITFIEARCDTLDALTEDRKGIG